MIEARERFAVETDLGTLWRFCSSIGNFAACMPGYRSHEEFTETDSLWVVVFDLGALSKRLELDVHVEEFAPPREFRFGLTARNEPLHGGGALRIMEEPGAVTAEIQLMLSGGGPLAAMMEGLSRPLIAPLVRSFAQRFTSRLQEYGQPA